MNITKVANRVQLLKQKFANSLGLPFRDLLPESTIIEALAAEIITYRIRLFDPFVTLWAFFSQVLDPDKSCANAVDRVIVWLASVNAPIPSADFGFVQNRSCDAVFRKHQGRDNNMRRGSALNLAINL